MADRLSALDASFLYVEEPSVPMHVGSVAFLRRHRLAVMRAGGGLLLLLGLALVSGLWSRWAGWLQGLIDGFTPVV